MPLSSFHPAVRDWFSERLGEPTECQRAGWPAIAAGENALIAAPTGSGKTLAAFLWAIDRMLRRPAPLPDATDILYVSPLRALSNDVHKNLQAPLAEIRARDAALPEVRVDVRTGEHWGNFVQTYSMVGIISSAIRLSVRWDTAR